MEGHERRNPSQPALIANALGEDFTLAKVIEDSPELSEGSERIAKVEPEVDSLLDRLAILGEMREAGERLPEAWRGFPVGGPCRGLRPGLAGVGHDLAPALAPDGLGG